MNNTTKRILTGIMLATIVATSAHFELVQWLATAIAIGITTEFILCLVKTPSLQRAANSPLAGESARSAGGGYRKLKRRFAIFAIFLYLLLFAYSAYTLGAKPWIMLLLLMTIAAADTGAWFFGKMIGGDKMWPSVSPNKTWAGQIAGILCGTAAAVMYGMLGEDIFLPSLMWIGMGVSLLSQYGDLAASAIKRRLGVKDFGNILPGHGGLADRFDGWIFVLPVVWLATL